jgi:hypothetical protein
MRLALICAIWLVASFPSWAGDQDGRFLEFPSGSTTTAFDLNTVQMIQPGRFTVIETTIDNPGVMKLELKVLDTLRAYCARAEGQYPAPADLLTLGPPDMPVKNIEVRSGRYKKVVWYYPYKMLHDEIGVFDCKEPGRTEDESYWQDRALITNGLRSKTLYDCKRGLWGKFRNEDDDPAKGMIGFVPKGTLAFKYYQSVCRAVTHETPYVPE